MGDTLSGITVDHGLSVHSSSGRELRPLQNSLNHLNTVARHEDSSPNVNSSHHDSSKYGRKADSYYSSSENGRFTAGLTSPSKSVQDLRTVTGHRPLCLPCKQSLVNIFIKREMG
ncbi:hypothetical protein TNCV_1546651 [Trichonephila clavipes]|nr:hypothetical protein TNCV_1546651 [Trichonephila clavipes]